VADRHDPRGLRLADVAGTPPAGGYGHRSRPPVPYPPPPPPPLALARSAGAATGAAPGPGTGSGRPVPDLRPRLDALASGQGWRTAADERWLYLFGPRFGELPGHGWKLHVSARAEDLPDVMDLLVPVLLRYACDAKFARGVGALREMNRGEPDPALVGKAATLYPHPADVTALGRELARLLAGRPGPRVLSDRQVSPDAPVFYRYGPFRALGSPDADLAMTGPDGSRFPGRAGTRYRQPPWAADPFAAGRPPARRTARTVGGHYRLLRGIARSPFGDVYRAQDVRTGAAVVVKQARPYVGEDAHGFDARDRLRHEHAVLSALAGLDGVPRVVDHVRHGDDEFLVTTDCGPADLRRDVLERGPYRGRPQPRGADAGPYGGSTCPSAAGHTAGYGPGPGTITGRNVLTLARRLLVLLGGVHARDVVVGDLKPANVVLGPDGTAHLVDFGVAALRGDGPSGATPGYSMPVHRRGRPPVPADDLYALGATLHFALTGMDPVVVDRERRVNRDRTLASLAAARPGPADRPARALVAGLLDLDPAARERCARRFLAGAPVPGALRLPSPPRVTPAVLDDLIAHTVATCVRAAADLPADSGSGRPGSRLTLYDGAAGTGLELLHHLDRPGVPETVAGLARRIAADPALPGLTAALYVGRTGVDLFLDSAAGLPGAPPAPSPSADVRPYDDSGDQIGGMAGVGSGQLALAARAAADGRAEQVRTRVAAAGACVRTLLAARDDAGPPRPEESAASSGAAFAFGFAHGRAGAVHFLDAYHRLTGDPDAGAAAHHGLTELLAHTPRLLDLAARPEAHRRYGSWCRGLAGIGTVLIGTGRAGGDEEALELGVRCARACHALAPRMSLVTQCCGLSGVGELLVDAAAVTGEKRLWDAATEVAGLVLARSGGTVRQPLFPDNTMAASTPAWATGTAGVLSFLRRLRARGGPRLWTAAAG